MKIKSLLLGSAAALVAVSGARAADAIIAEPEPVEYVRVCDAYGAGFFYIPGTETCLRIGGEVRYQIGTATDFGSYHGYFPDTWNKQARGRFFIDARSETEWGTLRGYIRVDANRGLLNGALGSNSTALVNTNKAFLELGGLKMGWEDSAWAFTPNAGAANYGSHSDSGMAYGYQQRNLIQYNFTGGNGFFATVSLEDDNMQPLADPDYMPDIVGKVGVNQGWGAVWLTAAYDSSATVLDEDGWAAQLGTQINVPNAPGSSLRVIGYYADSLNAYNGWGGEWSVLASYFHQFNPTIGASVGFQYISDIYDTGFDTSSGADGWLAELNVVWTPVTNFAVRTEIVYQDIDDGIPATDDDVWSGFIRFSRFF